MAEFVRLAEGGVVVNVTTRIVSIRYNGDDDLVHLPRSHVDCNEGEICDGMETQELYVAASIVAKQGLAAA